MAELNFYTANFFLQNRIKNKIKVLLKRGTRGPKAVEESIFKGLKELGKKFNVNKKRPTPINLACVLNNHQTLQMAINAKSQGRFKKIIAGPNIVVLPTDYDSLLNNQLIDAIIVPSQWVKQLYLSFFPKLEPKIHIWAAGVEVPQNQQTAKEYDFMIFNKLEKNAEIFQNVYQFLLKKSYKIKVLSYGSFTQEEYFDDLNKSRAMVYLSDSESQGLAMFEAWARGVPTLVFDKEFFDYKGARVNGPITSCYLSPQAGLSFKNIEEFESVFEKFRASDFKAKDYVISNFSNSVCAQKYLNIVENVEKNS